MKTCAILYIVVVFPIFAAISAVPAPVLACNIVNPPTPCANLPGANSVNGLGTLFQSRFQGIPGVNPFRFPNSAGPGRFDGFGSPSSPDGLVAPSQRETFKVRGFDPNSRGRAFPRLPTDPLPSGDPSEARPSVPLDPEQARAMNREMTNIVQELNTRAEGENTRDPELEDQIKEFTIQERQDRVDDLNAQDKIDAEFARLRSLHARRAETQSDNQSIDAENDSIMDEIESVIVKM